MISSENRYDLQFQSYGGFYECKAENYTLVHVKYIFFYVFVQNNCGPFTEICQGLRFVIKNKNRMSPKKLSFSVCFVRGGREHYNSGERTQFYDIVRYDHSLQSYDKFYFIYRFIQSRKLYFIYEHNFITFILLLKHVFFYHIK